MNTTKGLVSVIMPALNEEFGIENAILSVLDQQTVNIEVLVVDGGSVDSTRDIAERIAARDPRVRVFDNPHITIPHGLNIGLQNARGEFVARVDCHASVSHDYHARALAHLAQDKSLAGVGGRRVGISDTARGRAVSLALSSRFGVGDSVNHYGERYQLTDHASFGVYRVDMAREVGGWDERITVAEDTDFDHRLLEAGHFLSYDPDMRIYWQVRKDVGALFRQYRRYGRGKAAMVRKNGPSAVRPRHLAPPTAVIGLSVLLLASIWIPVSLFAATPYVVALLLASFLAWRRRPHAATSVVTIPLAFLAMHIAWGIGFIEGLILKRAPALASGSTATVHRSPMTDGLAS